MTKIKFRIKFRLLLLVTGLVVFFTGLWLGSAGCQRFDGWYCFASFVTLAVAAIIVLFVLGCSPPNVLRDLMEEIGLEEKS